MCCFLPIEWRFENINLNKEIDLSLPTHTFATSSFNIPWDGVTLRFSSRRDLPEMLADLGNISEQCHEWNVPLLAMMYPRGENIKNPHDPEIVAHVARIGA